MSRKGNLRGYEFPRAVCPYCDRVIAISVDAEGFGRFRRHDSYVRMGERAECRQVGHPMGREETERQIAKAKERSSR